MDWFQEQHVVSQVVGAFEDTALMKNFARAGAGMFPAPITIRGEVVDHAYDALPLGPVGTIDELIRNLY